MRSRWWQSVRATASSGKYVSEDQIGGLWQRLQRVSSNLSFLVCRRSISCSVMNSSSGYDSGNGGPSDPLEALASQDESSIPDGGDKRLWRTWIEERLGKSSTEEQTEQSFSNPRLKQSENNFAIPEKRWSPLSTRNSVSGETGKVGSVPEKEVSVDSRSTSLDAIFRAALKPPSQAGRVSNRNPSFASKQGAVAEPTRKPSFYSGRQIPSKSVHKTLGDQPLEDLDDFEYRVLGSSSQADDSIDDDFMRDLDEIGRSARGIRDEDDDDDDEAGSEEGEDWSYEKVQGLTDAAIFKSEEFDLEDDENPYRMRPDRLFFPGQTYDPEDLDLSKEADPEKPTVRTRKKYPSKDVLKIADFRNPRFLSNFIRESSRILPKRHFRISAKAQRKVAREIKTARILGLMPFTSMGDPPFRFLRSWTDEDANATSRLDGYPGFRTN